MFEALIYPQTVPYPLGIFKFFSYLKRIYLLDLGTPKDIYDSLIPELKEKIYFITPQEQYLDTFKRVFLYTQQLKSFGEYLKYPENLKYYQLHRDLFDEYFCDNIKRDDLNPIEKALTILMLAEEIDKNFLEVSLGMKRLITDWNKFFDEKILYTEGSSIEIETFDEFTDFESLQNIDQRKKALKFILDLYIWDELKGIDTLLITEKTVVTDIVDQIIPKEKIVLDDSITVLIFPQPINIILEFPTDNIFPKFYQILTFS